MAWGALAAIAAPIAGSLIGQQLASGDRGNASDARNAALAEWANLSIPSIAEQELILQQYANTGVMTPQLEALINMGPSAFEGIALNPELRAKQMEALTQMNQIATDGVTPADRAIQELVRRNAAGEAQAKNQQILQNMQSRGMGGSGAELISRLQASQAGADRIAQQGLEEAAKREQARLQAIQQYGNMASQLRGQDYGEQSNLAQAKDAIAKMNAANSQAVMQRNTASQNAAQQWNLQNQQQISNQNVNLANQQQQYNKGLIQQQYQNQMQRAAGLAGQYNNQANAYDNRASQTAGMWGGIGQGAGTILGSMGGGSTPQVGQSQSVSQQTQYDPNQFGSNWQNYWK